MTYIGFSLSELSANGSPPSPLVHSGDLYLAASGPLEGTIPVRSSFLEARTRIIRGDSLVGRTPSFNRRKKTDSKTIRTER